MRKEKCLYLIVTQDKYELPLFVGTIAELVERTGKTANNIYSSISHYERGDHKGCNYRRVRLYEDMGRKG